VPARVKVAAAMTKRLIFRISVSYVRDLVRAPCAQCEVSHTEKNTFCLRAGPIKLAKADVGYRWGR
jgi:hypothetical protein